MTIRTVDVDDSVSRGEFCLVASLNFSAEHRAIATYRWRFGSDPRLVASAPGRINLIGEHTDYSEGFVLPCAIRFRVAVAGGEGPGGLYSDDYAQARPNDGCPDGSWADYPRGVAWALAESGYSVPRWQASFAGDVPQGSGLSSSAAIEAATVLLLDALGGLDLDRVTAATVCCRADNGFVGVNSGIMDQYASLLCSEGAALLIDCRSLKAKRIPLDLAGAGLTLLVCDTRAERRLVGSAYNDRRAACERAAADLGLRSLRDATLDDLRRLNGIGARRVRHVVTENLRVLAATEALEARDFDTFGELMYESHISLRDDYEVSIPALDTFVEVASEERALGARLTGAGFGGCAIALVSCERAAPLATAVRGAFNARGFMEPAFYEFLPAEGATVRVI